MVKNRCVKCNNVFKFSKGNFKYCSDCRCRPCVVCSKKFINKDIKVRLCSQECFSKWAKANYAPPPNVGGKNMQKDYIPWNKGKDEWGVYVDCEHCSKEFRVKKYRIKRTKKLHCSYDCYWKEKDQGKTGFWEKFKNSPEYLLWRVKVYERDNYTCQVCGGRGKTIHPHHIVPKSVDIKKALDVNNGITMCVPCHKETESYGNSWMLKEV